MNHTENTAKRPASSTGFLASLSNLFRGQGTSAPSTGAHATATPSRRLHAALLAGLGATAILALTAAPASAAPVLGDPCPNGDIRKAQGMSHLPDCMALEMVSPPQKNSQPARTMQPGLEGGGRAEQYGGISPDGNRVLFSSLAALGGTPAHNRVSGDPYVASRDAAGGQWVTSPTTPANGMTFGPHNTHPGGYSNDFTRWLQLGATESQYFSGVGHGLGGGVDAGGTAIFPALLQPLDPVPAGEPPFLTFAHSALRGSAADHSLFVFRTGPIAPNRITTRYLPDDPRPAGTGAVRNHYLVLSEPAGEPPLQLLSRDSAGKVWGGNCGADIGAGDTIAGRGTISPDGSRIYFTTRPTQAFNAETGTGPNCATAANKARIMVREDTPAGPAIDELFESECNRVADLPAVPACGTAGPSGTALPNADDTFQGASVDGSKVYFVTSRQLTDSDTNGLESFNLFGGACSGFFIGGCDLYLWDGDKDEGERLTQITEPGTGTVVPQLVTFSDDGSRAYFTSTEVLTTEPGPEGKTANAGQANLYLWDAEAEEIAFIGTVGSGTGAISSAWAVPVLGDDPGVGGDGRRLIFTSTASLTADDTDGGKADVFRYDAETGELARISKAAPGGSDNGAFDASGFQPLGAPVSSANNVAATPEYATRGRWVSEDGDTIGFKTAEGLVPEDQNGVTDSYLWRDGELVLLPGTSDPDNSLKDRPLVSTDGETVAFQTYQQLLPRDGDTAADVYALRTRGGFPEPPQPQPCQPDGDTACQGPPAPAPAASDPRSLATQGRGNVAQTRNCAAAARRAARLSRQATRLRRAATRASNPRRARALRQRSARIAKQAQRSSNAAKRCRSANRRAAR